jgi:hypothetical protein
VIVTTPCAVVAVMTFGGLPVAAGALLVDVRGTVTVVVVVAVEGGVTATVGGTVTGAVVTGVAATGGAVWIAVAVEAAGIGSSSSLVSFTNAKASSAPAIATIAPIATVGSRQFGVCARRVRAGAPHSRHQS